MKIIERLKELRAKATPGEWRNPNGSTIITPDFVLKRDDDAYVCDMDKPQDADFIVAVVNALPALLEVAEAAEKMTKNYSGVYQDEIAAYESLCYSVSKLQKIQP